MRYKVAITREHLNYSTRYKVTLWDKVINRRNYRKCSQLQHIKLHSLIYKVIIRGKVYKKHSQLWVKKSQAKSQLFHISRYRVKLWDIKSHYETKLQLWDIKSQLCENKLLYKIQSHSESHNVRYKIIIGRKVAIMRYKVTLWDIKLHCVR